MTSRRRAACCSEHSKSNLSARNLLHVAIAAMPTPVLDVRRNVMRVLEQRDARPDMPEHGPANRDEDPKRASILEPRFHTPTEEANLDRPQLITTIDAEEDFDWGLSILPGSDGCHVHALATLGA